jgi:hypothetical protein
VPTELDWQPGEFLDGGPRIHHLLDPRRELRGADRSLHRRPCGQGRLLAIETFERDGDVWWQPTRDTQPPFPRLSIALARQGRSPRAMLVRGKPWSGAQRGDRAFNAVAQPLQTRASDELTFAVPIGTPPRQPEVLSP